uniref:Uncharacterized protein n=1 Tax=Arundo donax TaxID=35708 RepID=A0A0A9DHY0_ARUDO
MITKFLCKLHHCLDLLACCLEEEGKKELHQAIIRTFRRGPQFVSSNYQHHVITRERFEPDLAKRLIKKQTYRSPCQGQDNPIHKRLPAFIIYVTDNSVHDLSADL